MDENEVTKQVAAEAPQEVAQGSQSTAQAAEVFDYDSYTPEVPEGYTMDQEALGAFRAIAKEAGISKTAADKLVGLYLNKMEGIKAQHEKAVSEWEQAVKADPEIGGAKLKQSLALAQKAVALGGPELKELLRSTGLGSHPAVVKWAVALGKALSEDSFTRGSEASGEVDIAKVLFPNT